MRRTTNKPAALLFALALLSSLVSAPALAQNGHRGARIQFAPPRLALLARHLDRLGIAASWDFASITLDVLLDSYHRELDHAARERSNSAERRAKLYRWQHATSQLAAQIRAARLRLLDGASFSVYADPQHQVLIIVDGQPIAVSGPRPNADREIEDRIITQFCAYNDCSPIESAAAPAVPAARGTGGSWALGQDALPTFEIHDLMRCTFTVVTDRQRKARACRQAAEEALALADAIRQAQRRGYRIDWDWLAMRPPLPASTGQVPINADGAYLDLPTDMLVRMSHSDWQRTVAWLRRDGDKRRGILALEQADSLLN